MSDQSRADLLRRAVTLTADVDADVLAEIFADDVSAWSPGASTSSRDELVDELTARDELFVDLAFDIQAVDVVGDRGYAEWTVTATPGEALTLSEGNGDGAGVEVQGQPVTAAGVTVATFAGDTIIDLRQYWDEVAFLEALDLLPSDDDLVDDLIAEVDRESGADDDG